MATDVRVVKLIVVKRKHVRPKQEDKYGHWWFEIGHPRDLAAESYGWWPERPVKLAGTLFGVPGELNGVSRFDGTPTRDPYHGQPAEEKFHPLVAADDPRTDAQIADCLRAFARNHTGRWRWGFGGQNCHTFQDAALRHCGLRKPTAKRAT